MKKLFTLLGFVTIAITSVAQTAIYCDSFNIPQNDPSFNNEAAALFAFPPNYTSGPLFTTGSGQKWDISDITFDVAGELIYISPNGTPFTGSAAFGTYAIDSVGPYWLYKYAMYSIDSAGISVVGERLLAKNVSIANITHDSTDTMTLQMQDVFYSKPIRRLVCPATYSSSWQDHSSRILYGYLTIPSLNYHREPFEVHTTYTQQDSVTGYGTMKLKNKYGDTVSINVLQVQYVNTRIDSAFISGIYITPSVAGYTKLPAGQQITAPGYRYYMQGTPYPAVEFLYDSSFTKSVEATMLLSNYWPTGINTVNNSNFRVYPNPATNTISISVPQQNDDLKYDITNMTGQQVHSGLLVHGQTTYKIDISNLSPGVYVVNVYGNNGGLGVKKLVVQ